MSIRDRLDSCQFSSRIFSSRAEVESEDRGTGECGGVGLVAGVIAVHFVNLSRTQFKNQIEGDRRHTVIEFFPRQ